jgi:hypothetical protein
MILYYQETRISDLCILKFLQSFIPNVKIITFYMYDFLSKKESKYHLPETLASISLRP